MRFFQERLHLDDAVESMSWLHDELLSLHTTGDISLCHDERLPEMPRDHCLRWLLIWLLSSTTEWSATYKGHMLFRLVRVRFRLQINRLD